MSVPPFFSMILYTNPARSLDWRRTVLILSHKDKVESTLLKYGGVQYALTALSKDRSTQPSPEHLTLAKIVMDRASSSDTMALKEMYDLSLSWKNLAIWKWAVNLQLKASSAQEVFWEHLPDAVRIFGFKTLRETFVHLQTSLPACILYSRTVTIMCCPRQ